MKKITLLGLFAFSTLFAFSQKKENAISVIPEPVSMVQGTGYYKLPETITVSIPNLPELKTTSESVLAKLAATGKKVSIVNSKNAVIRFKLTKIHEPKIFEEGYRLSVKSTGIVITANKPAGLFYGPKRCGNYYHRKLKVKQK